MLDSYFLCQTIKCFPWLQPSGGLLFVSCQHVNIKCLKGTTFIHLSVHPSIHPSIYSSIDTFDNDFLSTSYISYTMLLRMQKWVRKTWSPPSQSLKSVLDDSQKPALKTHFSTFQVFLGWPQLLQWRHWWHVRWPGDYVGPLVVEARSSLLLAAVLIHRQWLLWQASEGQTLKQPPL